MARKTREPLAEAPPPANSSSSDHHNSADEEEDEDEDEDEDETQSSSDDEKTPSPVPQKPSSLKKAPSQKKKKHALSDSDSEDSDLPPTLKVKPIASKPIDDESSKLKKPGSKQPSGKRPPPETEKPPPKKTKISDKSESTHDDGKKHLFQRVWSEEDELVILKGMIDYKANKGIDPMADSDDLFEFIKKGLHFGDANKAQFVNKVQRMKKRFENPKRRKFNNPHDLKAFELSKQVWGISNGVEDNNESPKLNSSNAKASKSGDVNDLALEVGKKVEGKKKNEGEVTNWVVSRCDRETPLLGGSSSIGYLTEGVLKEGVKLLDEKDKAELNQKLRKHNLEEMEVYLKRLDLIREVTEKSLNALKSAQR